MRRPKGSEKTAKGKRISNIFRVTLLLLLSVFLSFTGIVQWRMDWTTLPVEGPLGGVTDYLDAKKSHVRTSERKKMKVDCKTAVVVVARYLTDCSAARLHHLVATTPPEIDVWFLHDHARYASNSSEVATSLHHLQSLTRSLRLQYAAKESRIIPGFDTAKSKAAKSSFLRWMAKHSDQYRYAWHIEEDVFYTGLWSDVFRAHENDTSDLVATRLPFPRTWMWAQNNTCRIKYPSEMFQRTSFTSMDCTKVIRHAHHWAILRLSRSFATHLLEDLESRSLYGHHEAVVGILLQVKPYNLTYSKLQHVGKVAARPNSHNMMLDTYANPVLPQRLYHPVKCQAYQTDLTPLLQQMVYPVNYSNPNMVYHVNYSRITG
jgi:hypothetical protein